MDKPPEKTNWRRIGLTAAVLFVPGGFLVGAALMARRVGKTAPVEPPLGNEPAGQCDDP